MTTKKQEDGGHFVVLCNTMLISIYCLCILVRTFWYIYLDMWKHVWCGFRYAWETSVDHWLRAIRRFFMKLTTYSFSLFYRVCRNTKRWRMKLSRKPILLSVVRGVTIISVDQFYSYFFLLISDLRLVAKMCSHRFCWRCRTLIPQ